MNVKLVLIGLALLGFFLVSPVSHYVPQLEDWNWMVQVQYVGDPAYPLVVRFSLPADVNDFNSLRVTLGQGTDERLVPFWLDDQNNVYVLVKGSTVVRLYWGKEGAEPEYGTYIPVSWNIIRDDENIEILHLGKEWSYPRISSYIRLINWDSTARGRLQYAHRFPSQPVHERIRVKSNAWGCGALLIPFDDENYLSLSLGDDCAEPALPDATGLLVLTKRDGMIHAYVLKDGHVIAESTFRRYYNILIVRSGGYVYVHNPRAELAVSNPLERPTVYYYAYGGRGERIDIRRWTVQTEVYDTQIVFTSPQLPPKAPRASVLSPSDVVADANVEINVAAVDPNNDLTELAVSLDGNELFRGQSYEFNAIVELNEGEHILSVSARDSEGAESSLTHRFLVDLTPPEVNYTYEVNDGNLELNLEVNDLSSVTCAYSLDGGSPTEFNCDTLVLPVPESCGEHTLTVTVCDSAEHCVAFELSLAKPCPSPISFGGGGGAEESPIMKVETAEVREVVQQASPLPFEGSPVGLGVILFLLLVFIARLMTL